MTQQLISVSQLFDGHSWQHNVSVAIDKGIISAITPAHQDVLPGLLVPGYIDIQVNGGGGKLFNATPETGALHTIMQAHRRFGTTAMLPTVITDSLQVMQQAADTVAVACQNLASGVIGIHFEGPHLSVPKKGVHPDLYIRPITDAELAIYAREDIGIKVVTVAPENVSTAQIRQLVALNVHVCLGHSNADAATVQAALQAGATGFTHLYNAMSPLTSREPGMVGVALADPDSWCGVILDGHHMHPVAAKVALAAKPRGKVVLVTDAMSPVGTTDVEFDFFSGKVTRSGNKLTNEQGQLAGSVLDMAAAVRYAIDFLGVVPEEALRMASLYPAQFLGLPDHGCLTVGHRANMLLLDNNWQVQRSWINGNVQQY